MKAKSKSAKQIRWIARISGSILVVFTLIMFAGYYQEDMNKHPDTFPLSNYTPIILTIFIFWGVGLAALIFAWWKEKVGGFLSLICFIVVAILNFFNTESTNSFMAVFVMLFYSVPSILFIAYWRETTN